MRTELKSLADELKPLTARIPRLAEIVPPVRRSGLSPATRLELACTRIAELADQMAEEIATVRSSVESLAAQHRHEGLTGEHLMMEIVKGALESSRYTIEELRAPGWHRRLSAERQRLMRLLRDQGYTYADIGRFFHRDYTAVLRLLQRSRSEARA